LSQKAIFFFFPLQNHRRGRPDNVLPLWAPSLLFRQPPPFSLLTVRKPKRSSFPPPSIFFFFGLFEQISPPLLGFLQTPFFLGRWRECSSDSLVYLPLSSSSGLHLGIGRFPPFPKQKLLFFGKDRDCLLRRFTYASPQGPSPTPFPFPTRGFSLFPRPFPVEGGVVILSVRRVSFSLPFPGPQEVLPPF